MSNINSLNLFRKILSYFPLILLFVASLNEFDFNYLNLKYFSFNFIFILIFYWSLKKSKSLGYGFIFTAGLINDVVTGIPLGVSSLLYLLICGFAKYFRNITLRPNLIKDWIFFLFTILVVNSISFILLNFVFSYQMNYNETLVNILFTFLFYIVFSYLFSILNKFIYGTLNA